VAFDPEHKLVLGVVFGKRSASRILSLLQAVKRQMKGRIPRLVTSDDFSSYRTVLLRIWPRAQDPGRQDKRCTRRRRCLQSQSVAPDPALNYATVCKQRRNRRIVAVGTKVVFGSKKSVAAALRQSPVSRTINTSFLERHNATDRHRNARKSRRTYRFSKDWETHQAVGYFSLYSYNFCWPVRTLQQPLDRANTSASEQTRARQRYRPRTPAMAAGLTDHVWTLHEWLSRPLPGLST
jgi:IS1 family transposase